MKQKAEEPKPFHDKQLMLAFALMADVESGKEIVTKKGSEKSAKLLIENLLTKYPVLLDGWGLKFGPALYSDSGMARNDTLIFYKKDKNKSHIVIAVAGTNFIDKYDWFTEDVEVSTLVPWNSDIMKNGATNSGTATHGYIAKGTATALQHTWSTTDHPSGIIHPKKMTPIAWLVDFIQTTPHPVTTLTVTGHSLGGAIAPVLATALYDNWTDLTGNKIDTIKINTFIYAGPTPGDQVFREYAESKVNILSYVNKMDVVPHAWDLDKLNLLYGLYESIFDNEPCTADNNGRIVYWTIRFLIAQSENAGPDHIYQRWSNEKENMINPQGALIPLKAASTKDADTLLKAIGQGTVNQLYNLTGAKSSAELATYTAYFLTFMEQLGAEHTEAYQNLILQDTSFITSLKEIYQVKSGKKTTHAKFDKIEAGLVLQTLIATVDWYYIQTTQLKKKNNN